jgi:hypothetical protein
MTFKKKLIDTGLGASLLAAAAFVATQTSAQTAQGSDQQTSAPHAKATDQTARMVEHCNHMMGSIAAQ